MHRLQPGRAEKALRLVAIGGGTGLSALLHGLKEYMHCGSADSTVPEHDIDLTAVVTVTDDGGSSGRLRRELDILPPGDIRACLVAMSEDEALLSKLFRYRFASGKGLKGHSVGNLLLAALTELSGGDFAYAVRQASDVLACCGHIYPSTSANVVLEATLENGQRVEGETKISRSKSPIRRIHIKPARPKPMPDTVRAIAEADVITLGPGSLFTSVIPNLLVKGIPEAIAASRALKVYYVNLMWQPGETIQFKASDHVRAIHEHARRRLIDVVVVNTRPIPALLQKRYAAKDAQPVENDFEKLNDMGVRVVALDLAADGPHVRHDPTTIAHVAIRLGCEARARTIRALTA